MTNENYLIIFFLMAVLGMYRSTSNIQEPEWLQTSNRKKSSSTIIQLNWQDEVVNMHWNLHQQKKEELESINRKLKTLEMPIIVNRNQSSPRKLAANTPKLCTANHKLEGKLNISRKRSLSENINDKKIVDGLENIKKKLLPKKKETAKGKGESISTGYPGKNNTIRTEQFEQWKAYYECLQNRSSFTPRAHYAFPGSRIRLTCEACLKPGDDTEVQWSMVTVRSHYTEEPISTFQKKSAFSNINQFAISLGGLFLDIYGVSEKDAGNYSCKQSRTLMTVHLMQVAEKTEKLKKVWPKSSPRKPQAAPDIILSGIGLVVFTKWQNWTSCSRCGHVGKHFRIGVCTVRLINEVIAHAPKALTTFKDGVPCRSLLLPKDIRTHPNVASRNSEVMEAFCRSPCPKEGKYIVRNKKGVIVETADNAKGVYSMFQKLPHLPPPVKRKIIFLTQWDTAYLQCPGGLLNDVPVRWFIGKQPIYSKGDRIYVTPAHILMIEDLGTSDSRLYSCWQGSRLVGTIRLQVSQPIRLTFSQQISSISMILIVLTFVVIFSRALCNAIRQKT